MRGFASRNRRSSRLPAQSRWLGVAVTLMMLFTALPANLIQPAAAQYGPTYIVSVRKYDCPPGFDAYNQTGQPTFDTCTTEQTGIPFSLTTDDGTYQNDTKDT